MRCHYCQLRTKHDWKIPRAAITLLVLCHAATFSGGQSLVVHVSSDPHCAAALVGLFHLLTAPVAFCAPHLLSAPLRPYLLLIMLHLACMPYSSSCCLHILRCALIPSPFVPAICPFYSPIYAWQSDLCFRAHHTSAFEPSCPSCFAAQCSAEEGKRAGQFSLA